jgi:hypothetical protein
MLAVAVPVGAMLRLPATEVPAVKDFTLEPERVKFPYVIAATV